jgi:hypothetical protein
MTKKKDKTQEMGLTGHGVEPIHIPAIDSAIAKYEKKKEARCNASPGEIAAKADLKEQLSIHRDKLPTNEDGQRFYRHDGVDYILDEVLKRRSADDGEVRGEE